MRVQPEPVIEKIAVQADEAAAEYLPVAHIPVHAAVVRPAVAPYVPAEQLEQLAAAETSEYVPAAQMVHAVAAAVEYVPAMQVPEHAGVSKPADVPNVPAGQLTQPPLK